LTRLKACPKFASSSESLKIMSAPKSKKQKRIEALERMERQGDRPGRVGARDPEVKAAEAARLRELIAGRK
jgi:hypothetical protein